MGVAMDRQAHWNDAYRTRGEPELSWFEPEQSASLELIQAYASPEDAVIDIGGGASRLVDALLDAGWRDVTVLDLADGALKLAQARLGPRAQSVSWILADVTAWAPPRAYALWRDRAAFHFLTDPGDRAAYIATMSTALSPGGVAIIATFAEDGPERCSGLTVERYAPDALAAELETHAPGRFRPIETRREAHRTPQGRVQSFQYSVFRAAAE